MDTMTPTYEQLELDFPAPLSKTAAEAMPLHFTLTGVPGGENLARDDIRITLGNTIAARYQRQLVAAGLAGRLSVFALMAAISVSR